MQSSMPPEVLPEYTYIYKVGTNYLLAIDSLMACKKLLRSCTICNESRTHTLITYHNQLPHDQKKIPEAFTSYFSALTANTTAILPILPRLSDRKLLPVWFNGKKIKKAFAVIKLSNRPGLDSVTCHIPIRQIRHSTSVVKPVCCLHVSGKSPLFVGRSQRDKVM